MMSVTRRLIVPFAALLLGGANISPAQATFPGTNGKIVYYNFGFRGRENIFTIQPDGSGKTRLTSTDGADYSPVWSSDGTQLAFVHVARNGQPSIFTMSADGSNLTRVIGPFGSRRFISSPTWAPDGTKLAYCNQGPHARKIFEVGIDGSNLVGLSGKTNKSDCDPAWSPDGTKILFDVGTRSGGAIATMSATDGSKRKKIVTTGSNLIPSWSPDGSKILFIRYNRRNDLYGANANGTNVVQLTNTPKRFEWSGVYSPDGTKILFVRSQGPDIPDPDNLWLMNPDGTGASPITHTVHTDEFGPDWQAT